MVDLKSVILRLNSSQLVEYYRQVWLKGDVQTVEALHDYFKKSKEFKILNVEITMNSNHLEAMERYTVVPLDNPKLNEFEKPNFDFSGGLTDAQFEDLVEAVSERVFEKIINKLTGE